MFLELADADSADSTAARSATPVRPENGELKPAKGIMTAIALATPVWAVIALSLYLFL